MRSTGILAQPRAVLYLADRSLCPWKLGQGRGTETAWEDSSGVVLAGCVPGCSRFHEAAVAGSEQPEGCRMVDKVGQVLRMGEKVEDMYAQGGFRGDSTQVEGEHPDDSDPLVPGQSVEGYGVES